ncbi:MAG TPA: hypothetical protein VIR26_06890 [Metalysinibacillus sp.]
MKVQWWLIGAVMLLVVGAGYNVYKIKEDTTSATQLAAAADRIKLADYVSGEWDAVVVVTPYTSEQEMRNFGIPTSRLRNTSITYLDDRVLLAFFEGDRFVKYCYVQRVLDIPHACV